ncbi:MAG: ABC transporter ATP-binding protein [Gammaproteobacteria bacterium]|nr:ABC transporter ATP-binding protein [Gammaproteobacteria bacterium]
MPAVSHSSADTRTGEVLLSVADLRLRIGNVYPVDGVSFRIARGETLALLGESGSGKSLTALALLDLLPKGAVIAGGRIDYAGRALQALDPRTRRGLRGRQLAMVFQEPMTSLNPVLSIGYQIGESVRLHQGLRGRALKQRCVELLDVVGIGDAAARLGDYPHQLSGGMKQRVMIAIALAGDPEVLIADEPTTALDVTIQAQILQLLATLQRERGMALLLITHDLGVAAQMADRIAVMYAGQIVEQAPREAFFKAPTHPYTQMLFRAQPDLQQRGHRLAAIPSPGPGQSGVSQALGCRFAARCDRAMPRCTQETPAWYGATEWGARCFLAEHGVTPLETNVGAEPLPLRRSPSETLLSVRDLCVDFKLSRGFARRTASLRAVDGVSFELAAGRTLALVGESGCGKTTVAKAVMRLQRSVSGTIQFDGRDLGQLQGEALRRARAGFQLVFQDPFASLNPRMRIRDMFLEALEVQAIGAGPEDRLARARTLMEQVGLRAEQLDLYPHQFSGGQRQRLCIARALAVEPKLLVCDEPTSALDVSVQAQILNLLRRLQHERGLAYLFISHDLAVVSYLADDVAVMYLGRIVERGPAPQVLANPLHPYTQALMAAVPRPVDARQGAQHGVRGARVVVGDIPSPLARPSGCHFHPRCPRALPECRSDYPQTYHVGAGQSVSCVLYRDSAVSDG